MVIGGYKFFAFSYYKETEKKIESLCYKTFPGWLHTTDQRNWDCFVGQKLTGRGISKLNELPTKALDSLLYGSQYDQVQGTYT